MEKTYVLKVAATGKVEREEFRAGDALEQLQKAVGGWIERVPGDMAYRVGRKLIEIDVFVNEEGLLKELPMNGVLMRFVHAQTGGKYGLVGNGVIVGHDGAGTTIGLDEETCDRIVADLGKCGANK